MDQYCVFGNPIKQSRSPYIHQEFAKQTRQNLCYQPQLVAIKHFNQAVVDFIEQGGKGANVTVPFKEQAFLLCDQLSDDAQLAGAVNTLSFVDGKIYGDNTDGVGLVDDLRRLHINLENQRILILGAGGAARGVVLPLLKQQPLQIVIANRTVGKAQAIVEQYPQENIMASSLEQLGTTTFDLVINATSASLSGVTPNISSHCLNENTVCYDMVYGSEPTTFMCWAMTAGCQRVFDGLGMLVLQAAQSFYIWRDVMPTTDRVLTLLRQQIGQR